MAFVKKIKRSEIICTKKGRAGRASKKQLGKMKDVFIVKDYKDVAGRVTIGNYIYFPKSKIGKRIQLVVRYV